MANRKFNQRYFEIVNKGKAQRSALKGPLRALRLCVLCILAPVSLIAVPLYLRYHVYNEQMYPLGVSDMRLVDSSVSTTWCQRQIVRANTTFNAYLLPDHPDVKSEPVHISLIRQLVLSNDMKEYWGFYLLKDSIVTVSSCVRWPGASMVMLKGHKNLKECAYLGDNSSEEKSEQLDDDTESESDDAPANGAHMTKIQAGVKVSRSNVNDSLEYKADVSISKLPITVKEGNNVHLNYAEEIRLKHLRKLKKHHQTELPQDNKQKVAKPRNKTSTEMFDEILGQLKNMGSKGTAMLEQLNKELNNKTTDANAEISKMQRKLERLLKPSSQSRKNQKSSERDESNVNLSRKETGNSTRNGENDDGVNDTKRTAQSEEKVNAEEVKEDGINSNERKDEMKLRHDRSRKKRFRSAEEIDRVKRELKADIGDADNDAEEIGLDATYIRGHVNEKSNNDSSNSEFWSSFSSSEERLMECEGLLLNLPLTPHRHCEPGYPHDTVLESNTVHYKIPSNGYYFFIYNSENEVQTNYLKIKFQLEKIIYNVSDAVASCTNETDSCALPLSFFSAQKVVLELPYIQNETKLNDEFLAISTCEPRTSLYLICVVAVPVMIVMFAFQ